MNLFLNAFDAMPETGGMFTVRSFVASSGKVMVEVEDNGSGMTDVVLSKIFVPFYSTKEIGKGTGLGLHVSDGIVKRHGGTIEVRQRPEPGVFSSSRFRSLMFRQREVKRV